MVPNGVGTPRPPANGRPPGTVWHVAQLPIAASSPPRLTSAGSKLPAAGGRTGSKAGRQAAATAAPPAISTATTTTRSVLRNIGYLGAILTRELRRRFRAVIARRPKAGEAIQGPHAPCVLPWIASLRSQ